MPELPDVEGFRRYLARHAQGRTIVGVDVPDREIVRNRSPQAFSRALHGARFAAPGRHGKWLIAPAGEVELLLHFGMTGELQFAADGAGSRRHDRVIFVCDGGELRYNNMRRFGGIWLARDAEERARVTGPLGPEAAAIGEAEFEELLRGRRGGIKAALMDQRLIAGVGNLLSDEIAWRAHVHPATPVGSLSAARSRRLYDALHAAVSESIRYGRVPQGPRS
jgi:formamidopyrimidine-DNA glycosylase